MHILAWRATGIACAGTWNYLAFLRGHFWRFRERLRPATPQPGAASVTAVIPARDERDVIERAVVSLRGQLTEGAFRIIVADDESTDGTGAASGADLVVRVAPRPPGWKGKLWAVASGVRAETGKPDYFLLTDADIEHASPEVLSSLIAKAEEGFDLVSVMVRLRCESIAEKLLVPAFVFFFFMLYPPAWVSKRKGLAAAAGGCMLIRRETLERIGGIESIRDAMIDDCALAGQVKSAGGRVWLGTTELDLRSIRQYGTAGEIRAMISRSAFAQLKHSGWLLAGSVAGMILTFIAPVALLDCGDRPAIWMGLFAWALSAGLFLTAVRAYRAPVWTVVCLPLIALFYVVATIESAIHFWTGRGGVWKGRVQDAPAG